MRFDSLGVLGAYAIIPERVEDERGFFARTFCIEEFTANGLNASIAQCSVSFNTLCGTVRGLHYQVHPHQEAKLVRCVRGAAYDVILDLRRGSATFLQWVGMRIDCDNRRMIYVPEGVAHGFQTLVDETELFYQISVPYSREHARGVRWDDPGFGIVWPLACTQISEKDRGYPDFQL